MPKALELIDGITIGADPELFIMNTDTGEFVCPDGLIPGTKDEPFKVEGGAVQQDGFAAEFNIDPCSDYTEFRDRIKMVRKQLAAMLPGNMALVAVPTATFTDAEWERASDATKVLGCSPDYNAWSLNVNPPPNAIDKMRHAGGHLHFGWTENADMMDKQYFKACIDLVRQLDWYLGAWSVEKDSDKLRRSMYGRAGSMRFKPYGVEYRTLSNFWLDESKPTTLLTTWNRLARALDNMVSIHWPTQFADYNSELIRAINTSEFAGTSFEGSFNNPIRTY